MISSDQLIELARKVGFDAAGICAAELDPVDQAAWSAWLGRGCATGMDFLETSAAVRGAGARALMPSARSLLVVAQSYRAAGWQRSSDVAIARYALGKDYHVVLRRRLAQVGRAARVRQPGLDFRTAVDTTPLLERAYARAAGLGWSGHNGMLVSRQLGTDTLLGALLLDVEFPARPAFAPDPTGCGHCRACIDACPTAAIVEPRIVDSRRCLAYWTIEHRGDFDHTTPPLGDALFGCDRCLDVCPLNRQAAALSDRRLAPRPEVSRRTLQQWRAASDQELELLIAGTTIRRAEVAGLRRNAARIAAERTPTAQAEAVRGGGSVL